MLSIGGVLFPIYWWCRVLPMGCTVCCLCGVVLVVFWWCSVLYGVFCMLSICGVVFIIGQVRLLYLYLWYPLFQAQWD